MEWVLTIQEDQGEQEGEVDRVEHALLSGVPEHWGHRRSWRGVAGGIVKQEVERRKWWSGAVDKAW